MVEISALLSMKYSLQDIKKNYKTNDKRERNILKHLLPLFINTVLMLFLVQVVRIQKVGNTKCERMLLSIQKNSINAGDLNANQNRLLNKLFNFIAWKNSKMEMKFKCNQSKSQIIVNIDTDND